MFSDFFFFFKQKTAYEMRISDWSSDVCSSDLAGSASFHHPDRVRLEAWSAAPGQMRRRDGRAIRRPAPGDRRRSDRHPGGNSARATLPVSGPGNRALAAYLRSDERRVGTECVSTCRYRWWTYHLQTKTSVVNLLIMRTLHH